MAEQTAPASTQTTAKPTPRRNFAQVLELDTRLLGMIGAFILMCIGFDLFTDGRFQSRPCPSRSWPPAWCSSS